MNSDTEIFDRVGPSYLTHIDWENPFHCRAVAACLVQAVYVLERDRQFGRQSLQALAHPWWNFANFQLIHILTDDVDFSTFGAIFENKSINNSSKSAPLYVIAFRGTMKERDSRIRDISLDLRCIFDRLDRSSRSQTAMGAVLDVVDLSGSTSKVWLAGHSLGSAIAMLAGKSMAKMGYSIRTFLFNPPFITAPIQLLKHPKLKHGFRFAASVVKTTFAVALKNGLHNLEENDWFDALSDWKPELFVNPRDHICSEYIGYFEHRKKMEEIGAWKIERVATRKSMRGLVSGVIGKVSEPLHLLPCANLTVNMNQCSDFKRAHEIRQWWNPDFHFHSTLYEYKY